MKFLSRAIFPVTARILFTLLALAAPAAIAQVITDVSPPYGMPGDSVVVSGSGFTGVTGGFFWNNKPVAAADFHVVADTQINITHIPAGATNGPISIVKNGSTFFSPFDYTVISAAPFVTGFSPTVGSPGNIDMTLTGVHFTGVTNVAIGGVNLANTEFSVTADTQLRISHLPAGVATGYISLTRSGLVGTTTNYFYVAPTITSFTPQNGRAGTNVSIFGTSFLNALSVRIGGLQVPVFHVVSNTQIDLTLPSGITTGSFTVSAPAGGVMTSSNFVVAPTLISFSPTFGRQGTNVIIQGVNFLVGNPVVRFNGVQAAITATTDTQLTVVVPANATTGPITVTTTDGTATSTSLFYLPPVINSFTPTSGSVGTVVTLSGNNFLGVTSVTFNGVNATFTIVSNITLTAVVPAGASSGSIVVTDPAGSTGSGIAFLVPPSISGISPLSGPVGSQVVITGNSLAGATDVRFSPNAAATFTVNSANQITATVPAGAASGTLRITTPAGVVTSSDSFTVTVPIVTPASLKIQRSAATANSVVVSWSSPATWILQNAGTIRGPWSDLTTVALQTNSITDLVTSTQRFYRLRH